MSIFPTDRPRAPARQRDGVPDRSTLSATGHAARPDSGDPTDRLSRAVSPPPTWVGAPDRATDRPSQKPPAHANITFNFASPRAEHMPRLN